MKHILEELSSVARKYKVLIVIVLLVVAIGGIAIFRQSDSKAVADFAASYNSLNEAILDYPIPNLSKDSEWRENVDKFSDIYSQIIESNGPNPTRLKLAKDATIANDDGIRYLMDAEIIEGEISGILMNVNTKAVAIKDKELKNSAIEIADIARNELNSYSSYRKANLNKRLKLDKLLKSIVDDNGGIARLKEMIDDEEENSKTKSLNEDLSKIPNEFKSLKDSRLISYARFKGLADIKD